MIKLNVGGMTLMCKDAAAAAKIVDLIATTSTPVNYVYESDDHVRGANNGSGCFYYAEKLSYTIQPSEEGVVYENREAAEATIARVKEDLQED